MTEVSWEIELQERSAEGYSPPDPLQILLAREIAIEQGMSVEEIDLILQA